MRFKNKVVLITGGAGDIGRDIALTFAKEGASVAVNDLSFKAAESVADKIRAVKGDALPLEGDISKPKEVERIFEAIINKYKRIDIFISNAGIRNDLPIDLMSIDDWDAVIDVQLRGSFLCTKQAQRPMVEQGSGKIIIIASPFPGGLWMENQANYAAANAGLMGLTRALALELGKYNINVNCVAPDFIETKMTRETARHYSMYMDDLKMAVLSHIALRRLGQPSDVSNVVLFLASDEASYISGQVIKVKGGP